ncbi:MAG: glutamate--tRNA ligase, partial [Planctomycetota bacterium]
RDAITIAHETLDDQILIKTDGFPTYHVATVVDDYAMGVTHILRAEEWIYSTPKHVIIYEAFGWPVPLYYHLPLLRNPDKSKISKRKNPVSITWYRENGFLPEAMLNFLARMGYSLGEDREVISLTEFIEVFDLDSIKTTSPVFDLEKLDWLNGVYIRGLTDTELADRLGQTSPLAAQADPALLLSIVPLVKERLKRLTEFDEKVDFMFAENIEVPHDELIPKKRTDTNTAALLRQSRQIVAHLEPLQPETLEQALRDLARDAGWKPRELFSSLRWAVSGKKVTPPLIETMCVLGRATCIERIDGAIDVLGSPENPILGQAGPKA